MPYVPLESVIHDFAVEMLKGLESAFVLDQEEEIQRLRNELTVKRKEIEQSGDQSKIDLMLRHFQKIKNIENVSTAAEGFVFDYDGQTYKFTGNFAPINQILGIGKYGGRGELGESDILEEEQERVVAVIPGKFKPPHRGHLNMVKHYAELADVVKVFVSPLSREAGDEIEIDAEDSIAIWKIYLRDAGLNNVEVMRSPKNSPVGASYDFVANKDNNPNFAQPGDRVILGASTKGGDEQRFAGDIAKTAADGVEILDPMSYVFDPPENIPFSATDFRSALAAGEDIFRFLPDESAQSEKEIVSILVDKPEKKRPIMEFLSSLVKEVLMERKMTSSEKEKIRCLKRKWIRQT